LGKTNNENLFCKIPDFHSQTTNSRAIHACFARGTYNGISNIYTCRLTERLEKNNNEERVKEIKKSVALK
jgi:hypothetical protein